MLRLPTVALCVVALVSGAFAMAQDGRPRPSGGESVDDTSREIEQRAEPTRMKGTLIVLNKAEASASILSLSTGEEVARISTGVGPHEVAVAPDGRTAVVCNYGQRDPGNSLTVIDLASKEATRTIDLGEYHRPHGIVFLPYGDRVVVTAEHEQHLLVVNIETGEVERAMQTGARISHMVATTPDSSRAFVTNIGSGSMCAFDLKTGKLLATVETGEGAEGIDVAPDGSEVWVTNRANNTVSVIDAASLEVLATIDSPAFPIRAKFTPTGRYVLVSNARTGDVAVFDAAVREEVARIRMDEEVVEDDAERLFAGTFEGSPVPVGILVHPTGSHAFIANTQADIVTVLDLKSMKVVGRLRAGKEPDGLGFTHLEIR